MSSGVLGLLTLKSKIYLKNFHNFMVMKKRKLYIVKWIINEGMIYLTSDNERSCL